MTATQAAKKEKRIYVNLGILGDPTTSQLAPKAKIYSCLQLFVRLFLVCFVFLSVFVFKIISSKL